MTGLLALVGGHEHHRGLEPLDDRLASHVVGRPARVVVLPLASSARKRPRTAQLALDWWRDRGTDVTVAPRDQEAAITQVRSADVIVLTGGVPDRLHRRLHGTRLWDEIVSAWRTGASLSGSSSGAMIMGALRQSMLFPFPVNAGFGLLPDVLVGPHYDEVVPGAIFRFRTLTHAELTVLGLDAHTAIVGRDGRFDVIGRGTVTVARRGNALVHHAGTSFDLYAPLTTSFPRVELPVPTHGLRQELESPNRVSVPT